MARVSAHLDELVREAEVLSAIKGDIPNSWRILEHEIGRARAAAAVHRVDPLSNSSSDLPSLAHPGSAPPAPAVSAAASAPFAPSSVGVPLSPAPPPLNPASCTGLPAAMHSAPLASPLPSPRLGSAPSTPLASATSAAVTAAAAAAAAAVADGTTAPARLPATAVSSGASSSSARHAVRKRVKLRVPAEQYPDYNFVGRLLGPRGATLKRLERDTGCRIMIRGKGSIRKDKEAEVRGKPGWEHVFHEPLHVVIEVVDAADDATAARTLARAKDLVEMLLVPVPEERDSLKRAQLRDLAILNGTHRSVTDLLGSALHPFSLAPSRSPPPPSPPPPAQQPPLRRAMSQQHAKPSSAGLYQPSEQFAPVFEHGAPFARQPSQQVFSSPLPAAPASRGVPPVGANNSLSGPSNNPSASVDLLLPGLEKLRIPALEFDALNEPGLSSPFPMPTPSPTIVDPEIYPYPPTPGLVSMEHQQSLGAFASPTWNSRSTSTNPSASLPPRSPPVPSNPSPSPSAFLLGRAPTDGGLTRNNPTQLGAGQSQQAQQTQQAQYQQQHQSQHHAHPLFQRENKSSFGTSTPSNNLHRDLSESSFSNHLSSFAPEEELPSLSEFAAAGGPASTSLGRLPSPPPPASLALPLPLPPRQATPSPPPPLPLSPPAPGSAPRSPFAPMPHAKESVPLSTLFPQVSATPLAHGHHQPELTLRFQPPTSAAAPPHPPPLSHPHRRLDHGAAGAHASSNAS